MDRDPVCGMEIRPGLEAASMTYEDKTYRFCSTDCKKLFEDSPKTYIKDAEEAEARPN